MKITYKIIYNRKMEQTYIFKKLTRKKYVEVKHRRFHKLVESC